LVVSTILDIISSGFNLILGHLLRLQPGDLELIPPALIVVFSSVGIRFDRLFIKVTLVHSNYLYGCP
ncbi:MAG TPA: hypothetical protein PL179_03405, partial [Candidatus Syntrophosphaera thermopropionivorans]|nr:hypothetical protein [Candidatus Syntrophosphaera thermopropionivorans]